MSTQNDNKSFLEQEEARIRAKATRRLILSLIAGTITGVIGLILVIVGVTQMDGFGGTALGGAGLVMMLGFFFPCAVLKDGWDKNLEDEILLTKMNEAHAAKKQAAKSAEERAAALRLKEVEEEEANGFTYAAAKEFYDTCVQQGVKALDTEVNRQRALLILQTDPRFKDRGYEKHCKKMFSAGQSHISAADRAAQAQKEEERIAGIRKADVRAAAGEKEISKCYGRDKRVRMLQEKLPLIQARLNGIWTNERELMSAVAVVGQLGMEKEKDWSISAGLASGIGGPVAGMAVASDINAQNAGIRERNAARQAANSQRMSEALDSLEKTNGSTKRGLQRQIDQIKKEIEKTSLKLMDESVSSQELAAALTLSKPKVSFTEGKTMQIDVDVSGGGGRVIAGEVPAAIDGSFLAEVYEKGKRIGCAYLNLPLYGVDGSAERVTLTAHCLEAVPDGQYEVRVTPQKLWLIEV